MKNRKIKEAFNIYIKSATTKCLILVEVPDVREILLDWDVVDPGLKLRVKKLLPFISHMKHQGTTQEEMFEAKACCHATEVEQIPGGDGEEEVL